MSQRVHAVIVGASIAGLCAARVLSDFYERVTVFDRDDLPSTPANRTAVPQGRHLHLLTARGAQEFGNLLPGLLDDMVAAGVPRLENRPDRIYFGTAGHVLGTAATLRDRFVAYAPSRAELEWQIRRRVAAIDNVEIRRRTVAEPRINTGAQRVTGVLLDGVEPDVVPADLVVDATGRGTRLPVWLEQWGYHRPRADTVDVGIGYASQWFRVPDGTIPERIVVCGASRQQSLGLGMQCCEAGTWVLTTFGVAKTRPPQSFSEMLTLVRQLLPARFSAALEHAEPIGEVAFHRFPTCRWHRYDKLDRFPAGIVPLGDAVASFDPTFGQGMTMTSLQAGHLRRALGCDYPDGDLPRVLNRATAKTTYPVWTMNAVGDFAFHRAAGAMPRWYRPVGSLFDQFLGAAETDPVLGEWFLRRFSLLDSLYMVPSATLVARAIRHNMRLWLAQHRPQRPRPVTR